MRKFVVPIAVFAIFVVGAFAAFQVAATGFQDTAGTDLTAVNESVNQQYDVWQLVNASTSDNTVGFNNTVTVVNASGTTLTEGVDYEWNGSTGAILFKNTTSTTESVDANVTYGYQVATEGAKTVNGIVGTVTLALGRLPIAVAGFAFLALFVGVALFARKRLSGRKLQTNR